MTQYVVEKYLVTEGEGIGSLQFHLEARSGVGSLLTSRKVVRRPEDELDDQ